MPLHAFKRPLPLIVAATCGLAAGLLSYPVLRIQSQSRVISNEYAQLSQAARAASQLASDTQQALKARALALDLPAQPPGCPAQVQQQLQQMQLATLGAPAALRVEDGRISCASLPVLVSPDPLPADYYQRADGTRLWHQLQLPAEASHGPYTLLEFQQLALLLKPEEHFARFLGEDAAVAIYESRPPYGAALRSGQIPHSWLQGLPDGLTEQQQQDPQTGDLLLRRLSGSGQTILLASRQASHVQAAIRTASRYLWSQALLIGLACMVLTLVFYPRQSSSRRELERALRRGQMFLVYQPIVDLGSGRCIGAEALMRWRQNDGGIVGPDVFIALAEQFQISEKVTARACRIIAREMPAVLQVQADFRIGINLAAQELSTHRTVQRLAALRQQLQLAPSQLVVELTEGSLAIAEQALPVINQLRANGISVAIDDFGTGYCSLSYLATYPFDILKIDKTFVSSAGTDAIIGPIAEHIVTLSKSMGVDALAEGVETAEQAEHFRRQGVPLAQGYHFGAPMPLAQLLDLLRKQAQTGTPGA